MKLGIDVNRHKEIIVKAISGLLLLLLKHFKLNHVYQVYIHFYHMFPNKHRLLIYMCVANVSKAISSLKYP